MFDYSYITILNISSFNTSKVTDMSNMFFMGYPRILGISNFDIGNVTKCDNFIGRDMSNDINVDIIITQAAKIKLIDEGSPYNRFKSIRVVD